MSLQALSDPLAQRRRLASGRIRHGACARAKQVAETEGCVPRRSVGQHGSRVAGEEHRLSDVTKKAVAGLQAVCPDDVPLTPVGRLDAMEKRLKAMIEAADWVQEALDKFYATLGSEQKARFNTLRQIASP